MDNPEGWRKRFAYLKEQGITVRFPWLLWFDGKERVLEQGKDFDCDPKAFQAAVSTAAKRQRVKVETHRGSDRVMLQKVSDR